LELEEEKTIVIKDFIDNNDADDVEYQLRIEGNSIAVSPIQNGEFVVKLVERGISYVYIEAYVNGGRKPAVSQKLVFYPKAPVSEFSRAIQEYIAKMYQYIDEECPKNIAFKGGNLVLTMGDGTPAELEISDELKAVLVEEGVKDGQLLYDLLTGIVRKVEIDVAAARTNAAQWHYVQKANEKIRLILKKVEDAIEKKLEELKEEAEKKAEEMKKLEEEKAKLEKEIADTIKDISLLDPNSPTYEQDLAALEKALDEMWAQMEDLAQQLADLAQDLEANAAAASDLQMTLDELLQLIQDILDAQAELEQTLTDTDPTIVDPNSPLTEVPGLPDPNSGLEDDEGTPIAIEPPDPDKQAEVDKIIDGVTDYPSEWDAIMDVYDKIMSDPNADEAMREIAQSIIDQIKT
jgi:tetratricopeptide (TPR) repeat protein